MKKIGILGGGQLGRMLLQQAANYPVETHVLENDPLCPAAHLCHHFTLGDINDAETVYAFGKNLDVLTIEIEHVDVGALERLEAEGVKIIPKPAVLKTLKNKIKQKEFYVANGISTSNFVVTETEAELKTHIHLLPAVHKLATGGYDGKGVQIIRDASEIDKGFREAAILEELVNIEKEISVIIAANGKGEFKIYPLVEMVFDPILNLVSHQFSPACITEKQQWVAEALALQLVKAMQSPGIFAVECFIDKNGNVLVNETAPRVHNSGHHTIEACYSGQFDMLLRILLDLPLGNPELIMPAGMVNLIGAEGHSGAVNYQGLEEVLRMDDSFVHIYGKKETRPGRKMGHITVMNKRIEDLMYTFNRIKEKIKVST